MSRKFNYKKNNSSYCSGSNYNKNNNYYYDNNYDNKYNYNNNNKKYNSSNYNYYLLKRFYGRNFKEFGNKKFI